MNKDHSKSLAIVVLAAGKGTRMESLAPKVLHEVAGQPMLAHVLAAGKGLKPSKTVVVVGHQAQRVQAAFSGSAVTWVLQSAQKGTGHAVATALPELKRFSGEVLILYGDTPCIRVEDLRRLIMRHRGSGHLLTIMTAEVPDPTGYGRILLDADGGLAGIVEEKDASTDQREIHEINTGIMIVEATFLRAQIAKLKPQNRQKEYYLTDLVAFAVGANAKIGRMIIRDYMQATGVNDRHDQAQATQTMVEDVANGLMDNGVTMEDPATTFVEPGIVAGPDTVLGPSTVLRHGTKLGEGVRLHASVEVSRSELGQGVHVGKGSFIQGAKIGTGSWIGTHVSMRDGDPCRAQDVDKD